MQAIIGVHETTGLVAGTPNLDLMLATRPPTTFDLPPFDNPRAEREWLIEYYAAI